MDPGVEIILRLDPGVEKGTKFNSFLDPGVEKGESIVDLWVVQEKNGSKKENETENEKENEKLKE